MAGQKLLLAHFCFRTAPLRFVGLQPWEYHAFLSLLLRNQECIMVKINKPPPYLEQAVLSRGLGRVRASPDIY